MRGPRELLVTFRFGAHVHKERPFLQCVELIERYSKTEQREFELFKRYSEEDQWIVSFWAEKFGGSEPPTYTEWIKPRVTLNFARQFYRRKENPAAIAQLNRAVKEYNHCHRKWQKYMAGVRKGAGRAIKGIEITNIVLAAPFALQANTLAAGARLAGGFAFTESSAREVGMRVQGVSSSIDFAKIGRDTVTSIAGSIAGGLISGKLSSMFLGRLQARALRLQGVQATARNASQARDALMARGIFPAGPAALSKFQEKVLIDRWATGAASTIAAAVLEVIGKLGGRKPTSMESFVHDVVEAIPSEEFSIIAKILKDSGD